jgi:hypothetical protein
LMRGTIVLYLPDCHVRLIVEISRSRTGRAGERGPSLARDRRCQRCSRHRVTGGNGEIPGVGKRRCLPSHQRHRRLEAASQEDVGGLAVRKLDACVCIRPILLI